MGTPEMARAYNEKVEAIKKRIKRNIGYPESIPLKEASIVKKAERIQSWVDLFSKDENKAKRIHEHTISTLAKYQNLSQLDTPSNEMYDDFFQIANFLDDPFLDDFRSNLDNFPPFNQKMIPTSSHYGYGNINPETGHKLLTEYSQDILTASLFHVNRKLIGENISI